ncbi:MAG: hypothetical protein RL742_1639, partial [Bacteroidota bacterium]
MKKIQRWLLLLSLLPLAAAAQQRDTLPPAPAEEEDFSDYENLGFADEAAKRYCNPKILDLSPNRFVSLGWDWQLPYQAEFSPVGAFADGETPAPAETADFRSSQGLRLSANIPVISRNSFVWQMGANFWNINYGGKVQTENPNAARLADRLLSRGLRTAGINTT